MALPWLNENYRNQFKFVNNITSRLDACDLK